MGTGWGSKDEAELYYNSQREFRLNIRRSFLRVICIKIWNNLSREMAEALLPRTAKIKLGKTLKNVLRIILHGQEGCLGDGQMLQRI